MSWISTLRLWAKTIERDVIAVWLAARDPRTPWHVKLVAAGVAAYALSPIDLIPDFVPVLGYLDDLIIVPLGVLLVLKLIPSELMREFRAEAAQIEERPKSYAGAAIVVTLWIGAAILILWLLWPRRAA
jgi:uncharacterized membrane protein YkvA (DUF1232 family)